VTSLRHQLHTGSDCSNYLEQSKRRAEIKVLSPIIANIARIACKRCQRSRNKAQSAGKHSDVDARTRTLMGLMKTAHRSIIPTRHSKAAKEKAKIGPFPRARKTTIKVERNAPISTTPTFFPPAAVKRILHSNEERPWQGVFSCP
jgi:hypothetical protein